MAVQITKDFFRGKKTAFGTKLSEKQTTIESGARDQIKKKAIDFAGMVEQIGKEHPGVDVKKIAKEIINEL